jgi:hypothetical protein
MRFKLDFFYKQIGLPQQFPFLLIMKHYIQALHYIHSCHLLKDGDFRVIMVLKFNHEL